MRLLSLLLILLSACQPSAEPADSGKAITVAAPAVETPDALGLALLAEVNALRARGCHCPDRRWYPPAPALYWNDLLALSARRHAEDMQRRNFFKHTGSDGSDFTDRIGAAGYPWKTAAENLALGYDSVQAVVKGWETSDGHCQNLLHPRLREMGAAKVGQFWVQDFGTRK